MSIVTSPNSNSFMDIAGISLIKAEAIIVFNSLSASYLSSIPTAMKPSLVIIRTFPL